MPEEQSGGGGPGRFDVEADRDAVVTGPDVTVPGGFSGEAETVIQVAGSVYGGITIGRRGLRRGPVGWPAGEVTDPFMLEVHRPIEVAPRPGAPALPVLPAYIKREHDTRLRSAVGRAVAGRSVMAVLVGGSSTGKTRACWEAIQGLPSDDWRVWHPIDPGRPEAAAEAIGEVGPRTVVWLNDAHHYLLTPVSDLGERISAGLRELLRDTSRGPVLVLGTIWPEHWATLTTEPARREDPDPHAQARVLLAGTDIRVADSFTDPALAMARAAARADPRLAEACAAAGGQVTQFLAGVPVLLERFRNAPDPARAVIEAAIDARRLGHGLRLPGALLSAMAPCYLTDQQWDALGHGWFRDALDYLAAPCRGVRGPLTPIRPRPGQPELGQSEPGQPEPGLHIYRLSDYLDQAGRVTRRNLAAPPGVWKALAVHADKGDLDPIAAQAERRALFRTAFGLSVAAADAGHPHAVNRAAELLERACGTEVTLHWLEDRVQAGDLSALEPAADRLLGAGRTAEALACYQRAADDGRRSAMLTIAQHSDFRGLNDQALTWYLRAGEAGSLYALIEAARIYRGAGQDHLALACLERAAEGGDSQARSAAIKLILHKSGVEQALRWWEDHAEDGGSGRLRRAAWLLQHTGRTDEALSLYERAAEAGDTQSSHAVATILEKRGRTEEALGWYRRAADAGSVLALEDAVGMLRRLGRDEEVLGWYRRAADAGNRDAMLRTVNRLTEAGRAGEALTWLREKDPDDPQVIAVIGELLETTGDADGALTCYQAAALHGDARGLSKGTWFLERAGRVDEALAWLQDLADSGVDDALQRGGNMLARIGRTAEAITWFQRANEFEWAVHLMEKTGRAGEAVDWLLKCADAEVADLRQMTGVLRDMGRADQAKWLSRYGIEPGGLIANRWGTEAAVCS